MFTTESRAAWIEKCRKAEGLGFDVIGVADHLGLLAPLPAMLLAAEATERVHVNSFVLNVPFYNPVLLAREVATVDVLSGGRLELGLGAGYVKAEFETAGIEFPSAGRRVSQVAEIAATLRRLYADPEYGPQPARAGGPPLLIAGWGDRMLRVAAEHADVVGFTGAPTNDSGRLIAASAQDLDGRVEYVRGVLGERAQEVEFNLLLQGLVAPAERAAAQEQLSSLVSEGAPARLEDVPVMLLGTPQEMADQLHEHRKRYGITYFTVLEPNMDKLGAVIELVR
jgi:probable F420-dependent oxidoreductase